MVGGTWRCGGIKPIDQVVGIETAGPDLIEWLVDCRGSIFVYIMMVVGDWESSRYEGSYPQEIAVTLFRVSQVSATSGHLSLWICPKKIIIF